MISVSLHDDITELTFDSSQIGNVGKNCPHVESATKSSPWQKSSVDEIGKTCTGKTFEFKGENLRHDHALITINIFSIKRK